MDTAGKNAKKIQEYIQNQLKEDEIDEQLELESEDPFTGRKNKQECESQTTQRCKAQL